MIHFHAYRDRFPTARLTVSKTGLLDAALHTNGGTLVFMGISRTFVDLFHAVGSDRDYRVVILTGSGNALWKQSVLKVSTFPPRKATTKSIARAGSS